MTSVFLFGLRVFPSCREMQLSYVDRVLRPALLITAKLLL